MRGVLHSRPVAPHPPCPLLSLAVLRYVDPPGPMLCEAPLPAERRPKFISVAVWGALFPGVFNLSIRFNPATRGEKGRLGVLMPETEDGTQGLPQKPAPVRWAVPGSARLRRACGRGRPHTRLRLRRACGRGRPHTRLRLRRVCGRGRPRTREFRSTDRQSML
jgi:hypothetical protein